MRGPWTTLSWQLRPSVWYSGRRGRRFVSWQWCLTNRDGTVARFLSGSKRYYLPPHGRVFACESLCLVGCRADILRKAPGNGVLVGHQGIRQHTSAYVRIRLRITTCRIRQHTSAYVSIREQGPWQVCRQAIISRRWRQVWRRMWGAHIYSSNHLRMGTDSHSFYTVYESWSMDPISMPFSKDGNYRIATWVDRTSKIIVAKALEGQHFTAADLQIWLGWRSRRFVITLGYRAGSRIIMMYASNPIGRNCGRKFTFAFRYNVHSDPAERANSGRCWKSCGQLFQNRPTWRMGHGVAVREFRPKYARSSATGSMLWWAQRDHGERFY